MNFAATVSLALPAQPVFSDGLGERHQLVGPKGERLEVLRLSSAIAALPNLDRNLREGMDRLARFHDDAIVTVRKLDVDASTGARVVVSDYVSGIRLSSLLAAAEKRAVSLDVNAVRCLLRQLVRAMAAWREALPDIWHSAIGPERIVITPAGRLVVADPVYGAAIEQLRYSRDRYWSDVRVPVPLNPSAPVFDARTDIAQVGFVALALVLGRRLTSDIYPSRIAETMDGGIVRIGIGAVNPLSTPFRDWLRRALQLESEDSFESAIDANASLDHAIGSEQAALERDAVHLFLARCLALDVRHTKDASDVAATDDRLSLDDVHDDVTPDVDLTPRIEALRAFLARYPLHPKAAAPPTPPPPVEEVTTPLQPLAPPAPPVTPVSIEPAMAYVEEADDVPREEPVDATVAFPAPSIVDRSTDTFEPPADVVAFDAPANVALDTDAQRRAAAPVSDDWSRRLRLGAGLVLIIGVGIVGLVSLGLLRPTKAETGTYSISTTPSGVPVVIDNVRRGITPLEIDLPVGSHVVELLTERGRRQLAPVTIKAGSQTSQLLELIAPPASSTANGELQVRTEPPVVSVAVDGRSVGRSPLSVGDLAPGPHTVVLTPPSGSPMTQRVLIEPGRTASLFVPMGGAPPVAGAAGSLTVVAPEDVQIFEADKLLGSNRIDRIMLPIGRHDLDIVNEQLGYKQRRTIQVIAGQVTTLRLDWPNGTLAINAVPWAEAFVDGNPVGETPIGGVKVPVGVHEVVFRHPELGERRAKVTVTAGTPAKVGMDLRAK